MPSGLNYWQLSLSNCKTAWIAPTAPRWSAWKSTENYQNASLNRVCGSCNCFGTSLEARAEDGCNWPWDCLRGEVKRGRDAGRILDSSPVSQSGRCPHSWDPDGGGGADCPQTLKGERANLKGLVFSSVSSTYNTPIYNKKVKEV